jgi:uncharacterized membrane protein YphA (DoxX/SURF4 family)
MEVVELIGRVVFVTLFLSSGVAHFRQREGMVAYARMMGGPAPELTVPLTGVMLVAGGLSVALGLFADVGALLIAAFLVPTAYFMHAFWKVQDPQMRANQQAHFMKNLSLAGAAITLFALYAMFGDELWMLTKPLLD